MRNRRLNSRNDEEHDGMNKSYNRPLTTVQD
jgi:hypothetical protein